MDGFNLMPPQPPQPSHTGRNIFIVLGAVLIVAGGFAVATYWSALTSPGSTTLPGTERIEDVRQPVTPEEKAQVLQQLNVEA